MHLLDRNEFQFDLPEKCLNVLKNADPELMTHYTRDYTKNVKSIISEKIAEKFDIPEHNVLLGYGAEDLLKQLIHYYLKSGEKLLVPQSSWWYYQSIAEEVGGITIQFPVHRTETEYVVFADDLIQLYDQQKPKVILIASPNNPTGNSLEISDLEKIVSHCSSAFICIDEAYWGYQAGESQHVKKFIEKYENVVILRTFSKYYGIPGVRIGFGFISGKNEQFIKFANRYLGYNRISEKLAIAAMESEDHYTKIREIMDEDKERYYNELRSISGVRVYITEANFILIQIPEKAVPKLKKILENQKILIKFLTEKGLENHLRISLAPLAIGDKVRLAIIEAAS